MPNNGVHRANPATHRPVAVVTGARRGIGRGIAKALAQEGFDLALADLVLDDDAQQTKREIAALGSDVELFALDVSDLEQHPLFLDKVATRFGPISCLVNNAGISVEKRGDLLEITPASFDRLMRVNLRGPFFLTQLVARRFLTQPDSAFYRSIINVSSANAFAASTNRGEYCISKAAITMATQLYAARLGEAGISAFEIRPGVIRTDMTKVSAVDYEKRINDGLTPIRRWGEPEDIGRAVAALASGAFAFSTGDAFHIDGGLHIQRL
ncbi:MAG: 3-ketoacyl-ACP reductase [Polaromonas sp.]|uniref:3-ketoacyl-ACP reductase n=1 Tax=Polaromonas sp. TaxID=1869339 RepID=UPI00273713DC|nr:3-ketoacyl-ACP reductase [Polaromonas sp.]MDP3795767.1 3-ketoacyl-ACP reductase [Polaromonas sp.]